jgi:hypothetical protein
MAGKKKRQRIPLVKATASEFRATYKWTPAEDRASEKALAEARRIIAERAARRKSARPRSIAK